MFSSGKQLTAFAVLTAMLFILPFVWGRWSETRADAEFDRIAHPDQSAFASGEESQIERPDTMEIRVFDGKTHWVEGNQEALSEEINRLLMRLVQAEAHIKSAVAQDVALAFDTAFSNADDRIDRFSDWHFGWRRKYHYLYSAAEAMGGAAISFDVSDLHGEAERAIRGYFLRNYTQQALQPELRQDALERELNRVVSRSHERFATEVAFLNEELARYLVEETTHLDHIGERALQSVEPDWLNAKWKAPTLYTDDQTNQAFSSAVTSITAGIVVYEFIGPIVSKALLDALSGLSTSLLASLGTELAAMEAGGLVGSIEPGFGTVIGMAVGAGGAVGVEWAFSKTNQYLNETQFKADTRAALDAAIATWSAEAEVAINTAISVWFDDARNLVAIKNLKET